MYIYIILTSNSSRKKYIIIISESIVIHCYQEQTLINGDIP